MSVSKFIPFLDAVIDFLFAYKENKRLKKENAALKRSNKRYEKLLK